MFVIEVEMVALGHQWCTENLLSGSKSSFMDVHYSGTIVETDREIAPYVKLSTMLPLKFANELWPNRHRCPRSYDNYVLKGLFVEGILQNMSPIIRAR